MKKQTRAEDIDNLGIMQGFMDSMGDDEVGDAPEEEGMPEMERTPDSPEILMNNLRGDMRSVEARRDELADLVGYQAATDTPETVLAMLQPVLAKQGGAGLEGLPQSAPMAQGPQPPMPPPPDVGPPMGGPLPPGGIAGMMPPGAGAPPPMPAPGAPPAPPMGMAQGGEVRHFALGGQALGGFKEGYMMGTGQSSPEGTFADGYAAGIGEGGSNVSPFGGGARPSPFGGLGGIGGLGGFGGALPSGDMQAMVQKAMQGRFGASLDSPFNGDKPLQFADGGYVQNFQVGSSPAGVTPVEEEAESEKALQAYPPELVSAARAQMTNLLGQRPQAVPTLGSLMETRVPEYQKLLGADKGRDSAASQMLLDLGQRGFNFAANVDDAGRPLRGGFFSRMAGAARTLPTAMGKHIAAMETIDLKLKSLALAASEKDQDQVTAQNTELLKRKSSIFGDILKAQAKVDAQALKGLGSSIFGKGDWEWNVVNMPGMMDRYAAGTTTDPETKLIQSAITKFKTPRFETRFDPVTREPYTTQMPVMTPGFVTESESARGELGLPIAAVPAIAPEGAKVQQTSAPAAAPSAPPAQAGVSLWKDRFKISGPAAAAIGAVSSIPGLGDPAAHITLARQDAELQAERMIESLLKSTQGSVKEQQRLEKVINIRPSTFTDPDVYGTRLIALGGALQESIKEYDAQGKDASGLSPADKADARQRALALRKQLRSLDLPPSVYTKEEYKKLLPGTEVLWMGRTPATVR